MLVQGKPYRSVWLEDDEQSLTIIDQTALPYAFVTKSLHTLPEFCHAIRAMQVRGAPLIGITAAFGFAFALREGKLCANDIAVELIATRPTAINLQWAVEQVLQAVNATTSENAFSTALSLAKTLWQQDIDTCSAIGDHGLDIIKQTANDKTTVNILTHCNAGWLATVDWGTALAPIYKAHEAGLNVHVWVDETRPRNQGYLTAWELENAGIPHTVIVDNTGGHLMQHGKVDLCLVGSDRTTARGDVCNKIGTYLKALAAHDNKIPFYVALPTSTIDWSVSDGLAEIPIEQREADEVRIIHGQSHSGSNDSLQIASDNTPVANYAFDVTPAKYISGLITEKGVFGTDEMDQLSLHTHQ